MTDRSIQRENSILFDRKKLFFTNFQFKSLMKRGETWCILRERALLQTIRLYLGEEEKGRGRKMRRS